MATVMTSQHRPSLPGRNVQSQQGNVRMGVANHQSNNGEIAPPLPSRPIRRQSFETNSFVDRNTAKAFSDPHKHIERSQSESAHHLHHQQHHHQHQQQHTAHAGGSHGHVPTTAQSKSRQRTPKEADDTPPPPPVSRPPTRPPPQYETAPPPPAVTRPPGRRQQSIKEHSAPAPIHPVSPGHTTPKRQPQKQEDIPPALPPARPPKSSVSSNSSTESGHTAVPSKPRKGQIQTGHSIEVSDFESRYRFHEPCDFPEPETSEVSTDKFYPSQSASVKRKPRKQKDDLGPL